MKWLLTFMGLLNAALLLNQPDRFYLASTGWVFAVIWMHFTYYYAERNRRS